MVSDEWPLQVSTLRTNLLRSTQLGRESESNEGNDHTILKTLRQSLMSVNPNLVKKCDEDLRKATEINTNSSIDQPDDNLPTTQSPLIPTEEPELSKEQIEEQ